MNDWLTGILPMIGIVIGAGLQYALSRSAERVKKIDELRTEAYADYLRGVAAAAHLTSDQDFVEANRSVADAKTRIVVYGKPRVIEALALFEKDGASLNTETGIAAFVNLVLAMRLTKPMISEKDIRLILLGTGKNP